LFHVALLASEFGAPAPTAPEQLKPAISSALLYYSDSLKLALSIRKTKEELNSLEDRISKRGSLQRPAIHYDKPLELPSVDSIQKVRSALQYPGSSDVDQAIKSYEKAINTLYSLGEK